MEKYIPTGSADLHLEPMLPEFAEKIDLTCELKDGGCVGVKEVSLTNGITRTVSKLELRAGTAEWTEVSLQFDISKNCKYILFYKVDDVPGREHTYIRNAECKSIVCNPIAHLVESFHNKAVFLKIIIKCLDDEDFDPDDIHHIRTSLGMSGANLREYVLAVKYIMTWN